MPQLVTQGHFTLLQQRHATMGSLSDAAASLKLPWASALGQE